jgi:thiol-disulfide isomerase/thioredoxin
MKLKQKFQDYLKKKSLWGKITDFMIIGLIIAILIPSGRLAIGGFVNRIKAMIIQPSVSDPDKQDVLREEDYNWVLNDMKGNDLNFKDFRGKVIFLNFWATWCPPCVGEMPEIQAYKDHPEIRFLMVSNEDDETVNHFIQKRAYTFPVYTSRYRSPEVLYSSSIPISFLISKDGRIVIREEGASKWSGKKTQNLINALINE